MSKERRRKECPDHGPWPDCHSHCPYPDCGRRLTERGREMSVSQRLNEDEDEREKVQRWRLHVLVGAGYERTLAEMMAAEGDVDIHRAVKLVADGCQHETAVRILL